MKKGLILSFFIFILFGFVYWQLGGFSKPNIDLEEDYELYDNIYSSEDYGFALLRIKEKEYNNIRYYLGIENDYYVLIDSVKYQNTKEEIKFDQSYELRFLDVEIYDSNGNLETSFQFYYSSNYENLDFINWNKRGFDYSILLVVGIIILVLIFQSALDEYFQKRGLKDSTEENNIWKRFKNAGLLSKLGYLLVFGIYLVIPFPFIFGSFLVMIVFILIFGKGFKGRIIALFSFLFSVFLGLLLFFGLYLTFVPEARVDFGYATPEVKLSYDGLKAYQKLIDEASYYSKEPVALYEENFGFIAMRTYMEWTYSSGEDISVYYSFSFFNLNSYSKSDFLVLLRKDERILHQIDFGEDDFEEELWTEAEEGLLVIEIRDSKTNELFYRSEEFPMLRNISDDTVYFGGQYMPNEGRVLLLFFLFTHLGVVFAGSFIYLFRKEIFSNMKGKVKF
jgi:hypothetical protein